MDKLLSSVGQVVGAVCLTLLVCRLISRQILKRAKFQNRYYVCYFLNDQQHNISCYSEIHARRVYKRITEYQVKWWEDGFKCEVYDKVEGPDSGK